MRRRERAESSEVQPAGGTRFDLLGAIGAGAIVKVFALLLLWRDPFAFWVDDYQISILPVFADVARSWSEGHLPLLSPYSWVCSNLAGEFQYGTFSIFVNAAVVLIWKLPLAFRDQAAALSITHLIALAMGAFTLARGRNIARPLALMVAIAATLNGWMISWGANDWFGALAAFAWLPWSWWALEKAAQPEGPRWRILLPAPFIYLLIAGGFPYTILMLGVVTAWLALRVLADARNWRAPLRLVPGWIIGLGLSAPAWMSLLEYAPGSRRSVEHFAPNQWLVPFASLPGLVLPSWTVGWFQFSAAFKPHTALELGCGLAPIVLLLGPIARGRWKTVLRLRWDLALLFVALMFCMLPGVSIFRFSFRWLALFHLVLALTAAEAYQVWRADRGEGESRKYFGPGGCAVLLTGFTWLGMFAFGLTSKDQTFPLAPIFFAISLAWWLGETLLLHGRLALWFPAGVAFATLLAGYFVLPTHPAVSRYDFREDLNSPAPLDPARLYLSIYPDPPSWYGADMRGGPYGEVVRPGSTSMFAGIHFINGYSPVMPAGIGRLLDSATHGNIYPERIQEFVIPEAGPDGLLAQLGIDGIVVAKEFSEMPPPAGWERVPSDWADQIYHRKIALPHVRTLPDEQFGDADIRILENSRHHVVADVKPRDPRPVRIIFSRPYFPGYHAQLNGHKLAVESWKGLAPTVEIPTGETGRLDLVYRPRALIVGGSIALLSFIVLIGIWSLFFFESSRRNFR